MQVLNTTGPNHSVFHCKGPQLFDLSIISNLFNIIKTFAGSHRAL